MSSPSRNKTGLGFCFCRFVFGFSLFSSSSRGAGGNSERIWRRVFPGFHSLVLYQAGCLSRFCFSLTARVTDCYAWPDTRVSAHSRGCGPLKGNFRRPRVLCLRHESPNLSTTESGALKLFALLTVESVPGAAGLLCGQRSYRTRPHHKRPLLF